MMWKPDICIYHFPCDDGFAAAWCVWKKWGEAVDFRPTNYGQAIPDRDIRGKKILIADFSFKPEVLKDMIGRAHSIVVLDHHKTAKADLSEFDQFANLDCKAIVEMPELQALKDERAVFVSFDMERSGASMTWDFCFPDETAPDLIKHIEDRDLWRMKFPQTRALSLYLRAHQYDFSIWDDVMEAFEDPRRRQAVLGAAEAIEMFYDRKVADIADTYVLKKIGLYLDVPVAHAPYAFASDVAHELLKRLPTAPFAAVVVDAYGERTYSLRSEDSRVDVSEVAGSFGGGGHRNAAGFRMPL